jgi:hypothetical protein
MLERRSGSRSDLARWFAKPGRIATCIALPPLGCLATLIGALVMHHDHGEVTSWPNFQLWCAARRFQDAALLANGRFPDDPGEVQRLLAPRPTLALDPWGRAFRYERLDDGERARVYTLGEDDRAGGEGCDADIVWWFDAVDARSTSDVREPPDAWRSTEPVEGGESPGRR